MRIIISVTIATIFLTGCVGRNFVRPTPDTYRFGETKYDEIREIYGDPAKGRRITLRNGHLIKEVPYVYVSAPIAVLFNFGLIRTKCITFYFDKNDVLIGTDYSSSFPSEKTDFKETDVEKIKKGQTTCKQVSSLLGPRGGEYLYPMVGEPGDRAVVYYYSETRRGAMSGKNFKKSLMVLCDTSDVVKEVMYSYSGFK